MVADYRPFEVHYFVSDSKGSYNGINYEVARSPEEARELFLPWLERMAENFRSFGFSGVEARIMDIREINIDRTGWKIKLERIVDPSKE